MASFITSDKMFRETPCFAEAGCQILVHYMIFIRRLPDDLDCSSNWFCTVFETYSKIKADSKRQINCVDPQAAKVFLQVELAGQKTW